MGTSSRIRRTVDFGRIREGMRGPGSDTRTWLALARVDDDDDAISYDRAPPDGEGLGWIVDVTFQGGELDQEGPIPCRVSAAFAGDGQTRQEPVERGCEVLVLIPEGNSNASPTIIGQIHNGGDCRVPAEVNGVQIDEDYSKATHILVTPLAVDQQVAGTRRIKTGDTHRILGPLVELADEGAGQAFVRGDEHIDDADALKTALQNFGNALAASTPAPPNAALTVADVITAVTALTGELAAIDFSRALSSKIKGE